MPRFAFAAVCSAVIAPLCITLSTAAMAQTSAPVLAPYAAAFKGENGLSLVVAPTADDKGALIRFQGINSPLDGVVFLADKIKENKRLSFRTTLDGSPWTAVMSEDFQSWGGSYNRTQAYLPAMRDGIPLGYDEKASKALDLASLSKTYQKQKAEGVQEKLARFDKNKMVSSTEARVKSADDAASSACGTPVKTTLNWNSINEEQMKRLSISGYCSTMAEAMRQMCVDDPAFKSKAAKHANITCQFGPRLNLSNQGGKTMFTTAESAPNQDEFSRQYLRNQ